ncbi:hypothetical protein [Kribbella sp. NPDC006257]|uniref:hypothetical protein n=1 Tax=Kribbella sp. NPDC006257 TaxID=3156738 RepID=UPI0033B32234
MTATRKLVAVQTQPDGERGAPTDPQLEVRDDDARPGAVRDDGARRASVLHQHRDPHTPGLPDRPALFPGLWIVPRSVAAVRSGGS